MSKEALQLVNKIAEMKDDFVIDKIICAAIEQGLDVSPEAGIEEDMDEIILKL